MSTAQTQTAATEQTEKQVRLLEVARAELASLKPGRAVYQKRGDLFLLTDQREAQQRVEQQLTPVRQEKQQKR